VVWCYVQALVGVQLRTLQQAVQPKGLCLSNPGVMLWLLTALGLALAGSGPWAPALPLQEALGLSPLPPLTLASVLAVAVAGTGWIEAAKLLRCWGLADHASPRAAPLLSSNTTASPAPRSLTQRLGDALRVRGPGGGGGGGGGGRLGMETETATLLPGAHHHVPTYNSVN
jgi:hypothetical protein